jgi:hypothetical protein
VRRLLVLLAVVLTSVASAARAQQHVDIAGSLDPASPGGVQYHLANFLDDPQLRETLDDEIAINLHWTVQLWRRRGIGIGAEQGEKTSWNVLIKHVAVTNLYAVRTITPGRQHNERFSADSLRRNLDQWFGFTLTPSRPGDWYYTIDLSISTLSDADIARLQQQNDPGGSVFGKALDLFILKRSVQSLQLHKQTESFTFPIRH